MKFLAFALASLVLISCAESRFELADESPLPHYFQIPDSTKRSDYRVEYLLYRDRAEMILFLASNDKKLAELSGTSTTHPLSKKSTEANAYPSFTIFDFNGETEVLEQRKADDIIYVVHENDIIAHYDSINNIKQESVALSSEVQLDNGKKWQANPETTNGIRNLQMLISEFDQPENSDSLVALSNKMDTEFKLIFKNCTMTGAAHDQLHNYLLPMLGMMKKIETPPLGNQKKALMKTKKHLLMFDRYFY